MADNDQYNDEYQFTDLDAISPETEGTHEGSDVATEMPEEAPPPSADRSDIRRKALIVIGIVVFLMVLYKIIGAFSGKKAPVQPTIPPVATQVQAPVQPQAPPQPQPVVETPPPSNQVNQKLAVLEATQQSLRSDVSTVNDQLNGMTTNLNAIVAKLTELNGIIASLNAKVDEQAKVIEELTIRRQATKKVTRHVVVKGPGTPKLYIQAIIPGRAWLIASNGATLTVREGTIIAGYGVVKLIDPEDGRVVTSSGRIIRFSQEDS